MRLIDCVRDIEGLSIAEKCLLFMLASYADDDGNNIFPTEALLAQKLNCTDRYIRTLLTKLRNKAYLHDDGQHGHTHRYKIPVADLWPAYADQLKQPKQPQKVRLKPAPPDEQPMQVVTPRAGSRTDELPKAYQDWRARRDGEGVVEWARRIERGR